MHDMGYYVTLTETNAYIPCDDQPRGYELVCEINNHHTGKVGVLNHCDTPSPHEGEWFSWMPWNYPDLYGTLREVLENVGFDTYTDMDSNLHIRGYDNKTGCEEIFLQALAPVLQGGFGESPRFVWIGEDHEMWAQEMHGSEDCRELVTKQARITWE